MSSAGGPNAPSFGQAANAAGNILTAASGFQRGGVAGNVGGALSTASAYNNLYGNNNGASIPGVGAAGNALGIYNGIRQGGVQGYGTAAINAGQLAGVGAAGYLAAPLALYNFANNWQSGATGSDALSGAAAGASVGSIIPGIGTIAGGLIGGAIGAASSAFGPGKKAAETAGFGNYLDAYNKQSPQNQQSMVNQTQNPYGLLAGIFDNRHPTGNIPMYSQYGRMGEQKFTTDMVGQINKAMSSGSISKSDSAQSIYDKVVGPWMASFGKGQNTDKNAGLMQQLLTRMIDQYKSGQAQNSWKAVGGDSPFANLPSFGSNQSGPAPTRSAGPMISIGH